MRHGKRGAELFYSGHSHSVVHDAKVTGNPLAAFPRPDSHGPWIPQPNPGLINSYGDSCRGPGGERLNGSDFGPNSWCTV